MSSKKKKKKQDKDVKEYKNRDDKEAKKQPSNYSDDYHSPKAKSSETPSNQVEYEDKLYEWVSEKKPHEEQSYHHDSFHDNSFEYQPKEEKPVEHHSYGHPSYEHKDAHPDFGYYPDKKDSHDAVVVEDADQFASIEQDSDEVIYIKDSCNISVQTTNTEAAVSIQIALQLAIALVLRITLADTDKGNSVVQDLLQHFDSEQSNKQKICIENSKDINIVTTDTDVAANIQALLEVLLSLVVKIDAL